MKLEKEGMGWIILRNLLILMGLFLILFPLYLVVINSFKTLEEAGKDFFALPSGLNLHNFKELFQNNNYWVFAKNSLIISAVSVGLILVLEILQRRVLLSAYGTLHSFSGHHASGHKTHDKSEHAEPSGADLTLRRLQSDTGSIPVCELHQRAAF